VNRRNMLIAGSAAFVIVPFAAIAQRRTAIPRIGLLWIEASGVAGDSSVLTALREGLRAHGYVEGKQIDIYTHSLVDRYDRLPAAADELIARQVNVIIAYGTTATLAAAMRTSRIPIVMVTGGDPVEIGVAKTLSAPGGNVTGVTFVVQELVGKRLQVLKEAIPGIRRVGVLLNPASATESRNFVVWQTAARTLNLEVQRFEIRLPSEIDSVISGVARHMVDALGVVTSTMFIANRQKIVTAIAGSRLPAIFGSADDVVAGGLLSYGPNWSDGFRRAAGYVARILRGETPANMPFEQPTKFELAVNLKAARAVGMTIPQSILLRADKVIE
jgi:putative ABC transport system substrate-binding protein